MKKSREDIFGSKVSRGLLLSWWTCKTRRDMFFNSHRKKKHFFLFSLQILISRVVLLFLGVEQNVWRLHLGHFFSRCPRFRKWCTHKSLHAMKFYMNVNCANIVTTLWSNITIKIELFFFLHFSSTYKITGNNFCVSKSISQQQRLTDNWSVQQFTLMALQVRHRLCWCGREPFFDGWR